MDPEDFKEATGISSLWDKLNEIESSVRYAQSKVDNENKELSDLREQICKINRLVDDYFRIVNEFSNKKGSKK